jgi:hypothetical protein
LILNLNRLLHFFQRSLTLSQFICLHRSAFKETSMPCGWKKNAWRDVVLFGSGACSSKTQNMRVAALTRKQALGGNTRRNTNPSWTFHPWKRRLARLRRSELRLRARSDHKATRGGSIVVSDHKARRGMQW